MAAPGGPSADGGGLLDLSFLTDEEREKLEAVLKQDEDLKTRDRIRLGTLRQDYEQARSKQLQLKDKRQCSCCERPLGRILNTGVLCPVCGNRVGKMCRRKPHDISRKFICTVCDKKWLVDIQAKEYRTVSPPPVVPTITTTTTIATTTIAAPTKPSLHGSELVMQSLLTSSCSDPELDEEETESQRRATVSSNASSIVVKYVDHDKDPRHPSQSSSLSSSLTSAHMPSLARKLTPDELSAESSSDEEKESPRASRKETKHLLAHSNSMESIVSAMSLYSAEGGKGDYYITGKVEIGVWHRDDTLFVRVVKAEGLAAAKPGGTSDPYVKTYLLPDKTKHTKRKTGIQRKTLNPEYNETVKNKLPRADVSLRTLWLSVWDWDRFGRNQFLGEVRLPLASLDLTDSTDHWYSLQEQQDDEDIAYRGKLKIAIKFSPLNKPSVPIKKDKQVVGSLHVAIKEALDLPKMDPFGLTDATVKLYLLPNRTSSSKKKTRIIKDSLSPVWNEEFEYKFVNLKELQTDRVLEATVWDFDRRGSNDFIGGVRLGLPRKHKEWMDSVGEEVSHWEEVLSRPGEWVEHWHDLRASMNSLWRLAEPRPPRNLGKLSPIGEAHAQDSLHGDVGVIESPISPVPTPISAESANTPPCPVSHDPPLPPPPCPAAPLVSTSSPPDSGDEEVVEEEGPPLQGKTPIPAISVMDHERLKESTGQFGSMSSLHNAVKGDYDITGEVLLKLQFINNQLLIYVERAKGLAAADSNGLSDPYVKTYLLPDVSKHSKRKTDIKKKTLDPVYKETLKYDVEEVEFRVLWLSVWDWDRFGRNKFLGEVRLALADIDFSDCSEQWYQLRDKDGSKLTGSPSHAKETPTTTPLHNTPHPKEGHHIGITSANADTSAPTSTSTSATTSTTSANASTSAPTSTSTTATTSAPTSTSTTATTSAPISTSTGAITSANASTSAPTSTSAPISTSTSAITSSVPQSSSDPSRYRGELRLGLMFSPGKKDGSSASLHIAVKNARSLPNMDRTGLTDGYVKLYLLPDKSSKGKRRTKVIKDNLNPSWEEIFTYERVDIDDLSSHRVLEVTVWDHDKGSSNELVGGLRIGPAPNSAKKHKQWMDSSQDESSHWTAMLATPGKWVEHWHSLRVTMEPRDIDLSNISALTLPEDEGGQFRERVWSYKRQDTGEENTEVGVNGGGGMSLSALTDLEVVSADEDEFKKVPMTAAVQHQDSVPSQEPRILSLRRHPERETSGEEDSQTLPPPPLPVAQATPSNESSSLSDSCVSTTPSPPLRQVSPHLRHSPTPSQTASPLLKQMKFHGSTSTISSAVSFGSSYSAYSSAGGRGGSCDISGEVLLGISYVRDHLEVNVGRARYLAAGSRQGYSNPYVKTYLLPDRSSSSKMKTSVKKKTLNPVYNEVLKYHVPETDAASRTLWVSVWDWDRFGRNQFLGEVRLPLASLDLTDSTDHWYTLGESAPGGIDDFFRGELRVGLLFKPTKPTSVDRGTLSVHVMEARDLPGMNSKGLTDAMVKCVLLPDHSSTKRKTGVVASSQNPVWGERFAYKQEFTLQQLLGERVLEVTVWDHDERGNEFIGGLRVGAAPGRSSSHKKWMDPMGTEVSHWEEMLSHPGKVVEEWHVLRPSMVPRDVNLFSPPPPFLMPSLPSGTPNGSHLEDPAREDYAGSVFHGEVSVVSPPEETPPTTDTPAVQLQDVPVSTEQTPERSSEPSQDAILAKRSGLLGLGAAGSAASFGSMTSIYSAAGGKGDYDITGDVMVGVYFKNGQLVVHVDRARNLAAADANGLSDPYVKTYLLPDKSKHTKKKTGIKKKTLNPVYDHIIKYKVSQTDAASRTLWLSVWDWDRFGRNQFLGEVRLSLASLDLTDSTDHWYNLQDQDAGEEEPCNRGMLKLAMMYEEISKKKGKSKGTLHVKIQRAKDLLKHSATTTDCFARCYLLPDKSSTGKRKTAVAKNSSDPSWDESFVYDNLPLSELASERVLEVAVWESGKGSSNEFLGGLRLGPAPRHSGKHKEWMDSVGEEVGHWESVVAHPGEWQEAWHTLRTNMNYRTVSYSTS